MEEKSIPEKFYKMSQEHPGRTIFRNKENGAWRDIPWSEVSTAATEIANGLASWGLAPGERVSILSENRLEWIYCDLGILCAAGVTVTIYPSNLPHEIEHIVNDSGSRFIVVSGEGQLEKLADRKETMPGLAGVISIDDVKDPADDVLSLAKLREKGRDYGESNPDEIKNRVQNIDPDDLCTMVYTSGTTGPPKGVMTTHNNILSVYRAMDEILSIDKDHDSTLSILPYAHVYERIGGVFNGMFSGITMSLCEGLEKIAENIQDEKPTIVLGAPRLYEKMYSAIQQNIQSAGPVKRGLFEWSVKAGREASPYRLSGKPMPLGLRVRNAIAGKLVFNTFKQRFGGRIRFFVSAAAPLSREIIEFFHALDIMIIEGWGMTETSAPSTVNRPDNIRFGSVGQEIPGCEVSIADDGEVLVRGDNVFKGYYSKDGPIREDFNDEGWFHTGDIGRMDEDRFLYITDRKKDIIITAGGKNIAPQNIENTFKNDLYISEALVFGDRRKFLVALFTLDEEAIKEWANQQGIAYKDFAELTQKPETYRHIESRVREINKTLAKHESIKRFRIMDRQFEQDAGEVTPTMKLKRKVLNEKFAPLFEEMYQGLEDGVL
ncbi:MAG: long-chain fatty acid--CoA ligase [bacterium]